MVRGTGLLGFPQAIFSESQNDISSPGSGLHISSSSIVFNELSPVFPFVGELLLGSGDVPADDPGPCCETEEAEGDAETDRLAPPLSWGVFVRAVELSPLPRVLTVLPT